MSAASSPTEDTRPILPAEARTLPARYYTDPEHFARELDAIHGDGWLWAGRAEQLDAPGRYLTVEVGAASFVVVRGERRDGEGAPLRAFHNVCRHRGTRLCDRSEGTLPGAIQCPYHAWTYGYDGALRSAPLMDRSAGFDRAAFGLHPVAVEVWDGHVFIHLGASGPTQRLDEHLDDLPAKLAAWGMADLVRVHEITYPVAANWKLIIQNYSECLHCPLLHPQLQALSHYMSGRNDPPHPAYLGGRMELRPGADTLSGDGGRSPWRPLPGLDEAQRRIVAYYALLPSLLINLHPEYMVTFALRPRAQDRTDIVCAWHFHRDEVARPGFDPAPAIDFWDQTNRQDWAVSEQAQLGIASPAYTPGPYSSREELLWALDQWVVARTDGAGPGDGAGARMRSGRKKGSSTTRAGAFLRA